jgi:hypothetical protein
MSEADQGIVVPENKQKQWKDTKEAEDKLK